MIKEKKMIDIKRNTDGEESELEQGKMICNFPHLASIWPEFKTMISAKILIMYRFLCWVFSLYYYLYKYITVLYKILYHEYT